jgi:hypothetical protein
LKIQFEFAGGLDPRQEVGAGRGAVNTGSGEQETEEADADQNSQNHEENQVYQS